MHVGSDAGGTFTDLVAEDGTVVKVPSDPDDPSRAVALGLEAIGVVEPAVLAHGTTVATNALLEGRLAPVALVTSAGVEDVLEIARQDRPSLYDGGVVRPEPLVPRDRRFGVPGRLAVDGEELEPLDEAVLADLDVGTARVVAVCLLHSDVDDRHERRAAAALSAAGHDVVCSCDVSPEHREYERTETTVVSAALRPATAAYLRSLAQLAPRVRVLTSAGGLVPAAVAAEQPAALLLSGPSGGVRAAAAAARAAGLPDAVTFDMGGTSTDVCLVLGGEPEPASERTVAGRPIRLPALDVHTIGAGGGSVAWLDGGGALQVGPRSAGAVPGPACYRRGGTAATVTDADLVAGRLPAGIALPGVGPLDVEAATRALDALGVAAQDVLDVVDAAMVQAVRRVTVERGVDPGAVALVAFGGAGPVHACAVAAALGMRAVVVPARAGVLSAVGSLAAPLRRDVVRSRADQADLTDLADVVAEVGEAARSLVEPDAAGGAVEVRVALEVRYVGQSHGLLVEAGEGWAERFAAAHRRRNGYDRPGLRLEVVTVRAAATVAARVDPGGFTAPDRTPVTGPAVLAEPDCTIWVPDGWAGRVTVGGALVLEPAR